MHSYRYVAHNEMETQRLGAALAEVLPNGTTVALIGTLGAGKTRLVQALAEACGVPEATVVSPTFVLCQPYRGSRTLYHLDAYRLKDDDEFLELGPEEYFESEGLTLIEWADRVVRCLPPERLEIQLHVTGETERTFEISALGARLGDILDALAVRLGSRTNTDP